ncbi:MAG: histidinol-phosphatase [Treponema sp.]|jgi:histidinol-phosphatase (PHP family)|nr:histidinol-phosphatase [Treponema sp.]
MYSCLHTHSTFCDGQDTIENLCRRAYEKGLASIGFSSHAPVYRKTGFCTDWHIQEDRLEAYVDTVREARQQWEGKIRVFLGLEIDYIPGLMGPADKDYHDLGLDYRIGSVHYVIPPQGAPFAVDDSPEVFEKGIREGFANDPEALIEAYWDTVEQMIRAGGFDILGHTDLIKKNNAPAQKKRWFSLESPGYQRHIKGIADTIGAFPVVVEVNTGGLNRYKIPDTYPSGALLGLLQAKHVPVIITADAHRAEDLDGHYEEARKTLLQAGYTHAVLFEGTKNGVPQWKEEPLAE